MLVVNSSHTDIEMQPPARRCCSPNRCLGNRQRAEGEEVAATAVRIEKWSSGEAEEELEEERDEGKKEREVCRKKSMK